MSSFDDEICFQKIYQSSALVTEWLNLTWFNKVGTEKVFLYYLNKTKCNVVLFYLAQV